MYESFFGLRELPFELTADPRYLFLTARQREALSTLQYGLSAAKPLTVMVGEAGTGKTTLIRAALESDLCRDISCVYLDNPVLTQRDFVQLLALRFDLPSDAGHSKALLLERLRALLMRRRASGKITALVVDEAQSLSTALLEEIRLMANMEVTTGKLLPLILAGQPELSARLESVELRQLKQRVTLRCELEPFAFADTVRYVVSRLTTAGGVPARLFTQDAIEVVHNYSGGIPRTINVICDNALLNAMGVGSHIVDSAVVLAVCHDLRLQPTGRIERPPYASGMAPTPTTGPRPATLGQSPPTVAPKPAPPPSASVVPIRDLGAAPVAAASRGANAEAPQAPQGVPLTGDERHGPLRWFRRFRSSPPRSGRIITD